MKEYTCGRNNGHRGVETLATPDKSPHAIKIICAECGYFIKWGSHKDVLAINTENAQEINEQEAANALLCPLMSGMVIHPAKSEVRPARLRFEGNACLKERCAWWVKVNEDCSIPEIALSLGTIADWRLHDATK